ncbi:MAG: exosortase W [Desulfobacterales bacterium]
MTARHINFRIPVYLYYMAVLAAFAAAFAVLYQSAVFHMVRDWTTPDGSHGLLILGVSIYLIWIRRKELLEIRPEPALVYGGLLLAAGCFVYFAGVISSTILVVMISMVPVLLGATLLFGGFGYFRILLVPVSYLVFLTGFVEQILGGFAIYFQQFAAWFAAVFFRLSGVPVFHDYIILELPHITLEVARACSGVGHLVALFALAVPLAHLTQKTWTRKIILVAAAFVIGVLANGLRIVMIGFFTMFFPEAGVHGPYETFQVAVIFFLGLILLLVLSGILAGKKGKDNPGNPHDNEDIGDASPSSSSSADHPVKNPPGSRIVLSFVIGAVIFGITLSLAHFYTPKAVALATPLDSIPVRIAGFTGTEIDGVDEALRPFPAHNELFRRYEDGSGKTATLYIGYFRIQDRSKKIIDYRRAWMHEELSQVAVSGGGKTFKINRTHLRRQGESRNVYFWYSMNGRIIRNQYVGKAMTFLNAFFTRTNNAAVIVISTPHSREELNPFLPELVQAADNYLSSM